MNKTKKVGYYLSKSGKDVIDWCEDFGLMDNAYVFTIMKYLARAGKKPGNSAMQDLKKALDYLTRYINYIENQDEAEIYDGQTVKTILSDKKLRLKKDEAEPEPDQWTAPPPSPYNPVQIHPTWVDPNVNDVSPRVTCDSNTTSTAKVGFVEYDATNSEKDK